MHPLVRTLNQSYVYSTWREQWMGEQLIRCPFAVGAHMFRRRQKGHLGGRRYRHVVASYSPATKNGEINKRSCYSIHSTANRRGGSVKFKRFDSPSLFLLFFFSTPRNLGERSLSTVSYANFCNWTFVDSCETPGPVVISPSTDVYLSTGPPPAGGLWQF